MLPEYLSRNLHRILESEDQLLDSWSSVYDWPLYSGFEAMKRLNQRFGSKIINRKDLIELYRSNDNQLAVVATMVWGWLSGSLPNVKGDKTTTNFYLMLSHPAEKIDAAFIELVPLLEKGGIADAYRLLDTGGPHKIPGVGPAFFTKILFFIGMAAGKRIAVKPLIFDKWTTCAFFALASQDRPEILADYFTPSSSIGLPFRYSKNLGAELYSLYVGKMNEWAAELSELAGAELSPAKLEEFVFGTAKNRKRTDNPRIELEQLAHANLHLIEKKRPLPGPSDILITGA